MAASTSRTSEFRDLVKEKEKEIPEAKRRKLSRTSKRNTDEEKDVQAALNKEYITEGYNIVRMSRATPSARSPMANAPGSSTTLTRSRACWPRSRSHT